MNEMTPKDLKAYILRLTDAENQLGPRMYGLACVAAWEADRLAGHEWATEARVSRARIEALERERDKWHSIASAMNELDSWIGKECGYPQDDDETTLATKEK